MRVPWIMLLGLVPACALPDRADPETVEASVRGVMEAQRAAWNSGDIDGFMAAYAADVCFISPERTTCGRDQVTANYRRAYPDKERMGMLEFDVAEVLALTEDQAWSTGRWSLYRSNDTLSGGFTLLWSLQDGNWSIRRDHTY